MIEELFSKRKQINFFRDDLYPKEELIKSLLEKTYEAVPSKQNLMPYEVLVLGPDQAEAKTKLYNLAGKKYYDATNIHDSESNFTKPPQNFQLLAPYVLLFTQRLALPANKTTMARLRRGHRYQVCDPEKYKKAIIIPTIEIGMFMTTLTALCMENNIDVAYTGCLPNSETSYKNIEYVNEKVYVAMSLGYEKIYVKIEDEDKPRLDEVITWI